MKRQPFGLLLSLSLCLMMAFLVMFAFTACQNNSHDGNNDRNLSSDQTLRLALIDDPTTFDPRQVGDIPSMTVHQMLYEGLMRIGPDNKPTPALAENVTVSEDKITYTFYLRESRWSDGSLITAYDFEDSWKSTLDPGFPAKFAYLLYPIKNAEKAKQGKVPVKEIGITAVDERTLVVELEHPTPYFLELAAQPFCYPVPKQKRQADAQWGKEEPNNLVTNGPFLLKNVQPGNQLTLARNPYYWDSQVVALNEITISIIPQDQTRLMMFEDDQIDFVGYPLGHLPADSLKPLQKAGKLYSVDEPMTFMLEFNVTKPPFDNVKMRQAFGLAVNRQAIVDHITQMGELPALGLLPPSLGLGESHYYRDNDVVLARQRFQEALDEMGIKKERLPSITLHYNLTDENHRIVQTVQQQWKEAFSIPIHLESNEWGVYVDRLTRRDFQIARLTWKSLVRDPIFLLDLYQYRDRETNHTLWENPEYISMINTALHSTDTEKRLQLLLDAEEILMDEMPIIPIYYRKNHLLMNDRLKGLGLTGPANFEVKHAYIQDNSHG